MKSEIIPNPNTKTELQFPCLMESNTTGAVVLFTASTYGTVVYRGTNSAPLGVVKESWTRADTDAWTPFTRIITLSN